MLEKTFESPLDWKEIKPVNSKGNQYWLCIRGTYSEAKAPIFWPPDAKRRLIGKDPDAGQDWRQEEKGMTEDEWLHGITDLMDMSLSKLHELVMASNHSSSVIPFSSCLQSFPASGFFQMSQLFTWGGQSIGVSASALVLPMNIQDWFPLGLTGLVFLQSKGLSRVFSNTTVQKHQFFST